MTVKFSEMCAVRTDLAGRVESAIASYLDEIVQGHGAYLALAIADGETEFDDRHQLVLLARRVKHHRQHRGCPILLRKMRQPVAAAGRSSLSTARASGRCG